MTNRFFGFFCLFFAFFFLFNISTVFAGDTVYSMPSGGVDASDGGNAPFDQSEISKLSASDDERIQSNATSWPAEGAYNEERYIEFIFSPEIPEGATVENVKITHEFRRSGALSGAKLEIWDGNVFVDRTIQTGIINTDITETIDITSIIDTPAKVNNLRARFLAYRGAGSNTKTSHDFIGLEITYNYYFSPNNPPQAENQTIEMSVDEPVYISLVASDADNDPLVFSIESFPEKGILGTLSDNTILYTPTGGLGEDVFTFRANDGKDMSNVGNINFNLKHGALKKLSIRAEPETLEVENKSVIYLTGKDKFENITINDNETAITFTANGNATVTPDEAVFSLGETKTYLTSSEPGIFTVEASSNFIEPVYVNVVFSANAIEVNPMDTNSSLITEVVHLLPAKNQKEAENPVLDMVRKTDLVLIGEKEKATDYPKQIDFVKNNQNQTNQKEENEGKYLEASAITAEGSMVKEFLGYFTRHFSVYGILRFLFNM